MKYRSTYGDFDRDIFCPQKMEEKYSGAFPKLKGRSTRSLQKVLIRLKLKLSIKGFLALKVQISPNLYISKNCTWLFRQRPLCLVTFYYLSADIVSTVEFNHDGELLATGDKGGRIVIFQKEDAVSFKYQPLKYSIFRGAYVFLLMFSDFSRRDLLIMANTTSTVLSKVTNLSLIIWRV